MKFEQEPTLLRDLKSGEVFKSRNIISEYVENLGDDKHLIKSVGLEVDSGHEYIVPHGSFPVFKRIKE